jgi:hypothetical protein
LWRSYKRAWGVSAQLGIIQTRLTELSTPALLPPGRHGRPPQTAPPPCPLLSSTGRKLLSRPVKSTSGQVTAMPVTYADAGCFQAHRRSAWRSLLCRTNPPTSAALHVDTALRLRATLLRPTLNLKTAFVQARRHCHRLFCARGKRLQVTSDRVCEPRNGGNANAGCRFVGHLGMHAAPSRLSLPNLKRGCIARQ